MAVGTATILRGDARALPLPDASVDLIVTSPPYFALRSYLDGGEHYDGQIGAEPTPAEYIANLIECTREWMRVLKPGGSIWVNLGDSYANRATPDRIGSSDGATARAARPGRPTCVGTGVRPKSLNLLPERYRIAAVDQLGLIARAVVIWSKPNGLPESVTDRVRRSHEDWVHLTKQPRYFSAVDEIREAHNGNAHSSGNGASRRWVSSNDGRRHRALDTDPSEYNPLGKLPGSVWEIASEPLVVPDHLGVEHFAAFPTEWPRRLILGWSPSRICTDCGEGRRPTTSVERVADRPRRVQGRTVDALLGGHGADGRAGSRRSRVATITGEQCACAEPTAPSTPAVIVDPFGGTGTTALVARALGRHGISVDRSADYCRLAAWRTSDPGQLAKALQVPAPPKQSTGQLDMFDLGAQS